MAIAHIRMCIALAALLAAAAGTAPAQDDTSPIVLSPGNVEVASYPVDVQGCALMSTPGKQSLDLDPYKIKGIKPLAGQRVEAVLFPNTPVFLFYLQHFKELNENNLAFASGMRCFHRLNQMQNADLNLSGLSTGRYLIIITTSRLKTSYGSVRNRSNGTDSFGMPITVETETPTTDTYTVSSSYGTAVDITEKGVQSGTVVRILGYGDEN